MYDSIAADVKNHSGVKFGHLSKLDKNSTTDTVQISTTLDVGDVHDDDIPRVFLKVSFEEKPPPAAENGNLATERRVYMEVTNKLLFQRATPHIIACYGVLHEGNISIKSLEGIEQNLTRSDRAHLIKNGFYPQKPVALVLEAAQFSSQLYVPRRKDASGGTGSEYGDILFQVLWTLLCFQDVGLRHNDLHTGNIFVRNMGRAKTYVYVLSEEVAFSLTTNTHVLIYDFDRSDKVSTEVMPCEIINPHNKIFDCPQLGAGCRDGRVGNGDLIRFLRFFLKLQLPDDVRRTIDKFANAEAILGITAENGYVFDGYPCRGKFHDSKPCVPDVTTQFITQPLETAVMFAGENITRVSAKDSVDNFCDAVRVFARPTLSPGILQLCRNAVKEESRKKFSETAQCSLQ